MTWNPGPHSTSTVGRADAGWVSRFLRADAERQARMLETLSDRLERDLVNLPEKQLPSKEWIRAARLRLDGFRALAQLELETARLKLLAARVGQGERELTDEEYEAGKLELGLETLQSMPVDRLGTELARRGLVLMPAPKTADDAAEEDRRRDEHMAKYHDGDYCDRSCRPTDPRKEQR